MCGRYTQRRSLTQLKLACEPRLLTPSPRYPDLDALTRFNVAPTQPAVVVRDHDLAVMRWGLVPHWAKELAIGNRMINARGETLADKPAFRSAYRSRRCVVPADGFYEWRKPVSGKGPKQPYVIHWTDHRELAFAGLWEAWRDADGSDWETFTIITTAANDLMAPIHERMPVILGCEQAEIWLSRDTPMPTLAGLLRPCPDDWLTFWPVSTLVNSPRNDRPQCVERVPTNEKD